MASWSKHMGTVPPAGPPESSVDEELNRHLLLTRSPLEGLTVDAIVLPNDLTQGSALGMRVAKAAGRGFEKPKVALGQAVHADARALAARSVLHTALPRFNPAFRAACATALSDSTSSVLTAALGASLNTVGLPSLHPEDAGWPQEWACRTVLKALRTWLDRQPRPPPLTVTLCLDSAAEYELYQAQLPIYFPRNDPPGASAYSTGGAVVPRAATLLPPAAEASRLGAGDDWRAGRFAYSREALGADPAAELSSLTADMRAEQITRFVGHDRDGRPTLLIVVERAAAQLTPEARDRLLLHVLMVLEPLASACGDEGFALLLLHSDFAWDMDLAWLQQARARVKADAPLLAAKLGRLYVLRPTMWLRSLFGMARSFISDKFWEKLVYVERDDGLGAHFELPRLSTPAGVAIKGVASTAAEPTLDELRRGAAAAEALESRAADAADAAAGAAYDAAEGERQRALEVAAAEGDLPAEAALGAAAHARAMATAEGRAAAVAAARAAAEEEVRLLIAEKAAAERDRDFFAGRLEALAAGGGAGGGGGGGGGARGGDGGEAAQLQLQSVQRKLEEAGAAAEAARKQCADAVRERHTLKVQLGAANEKLAEARAALDARAETEGALLASLRADGGGGEGEGATVSRALVELQRQLARVVGEKASLEQRQRLERDAARQEAAAARTEALQLRAEREGALTRLREQLAAAEARGREEGRRALQLQAEREMAISTLRSDRDAALAQAQGLQQRASEAVAERDAAWAHAATDKELLDRALKRAHALLQQAQQEKEEAAYLARQDKQLLANELRARHAEASAERAARADEARQREQRDAAAAAARDAAAAQERTLAAEMAAANAAANAAQVQLRRTEAELADERGRARQAAAQAAAALAEASAARGAMEHGAAVRALSERLAEHVERQAGGAEELTAEVRGLAALIGGGAGQGLGTPRELAQAIAREQEAGGATAGLVAAVTRLREEAALAPAVEGLSAALVEERAFLGGWAARLRTHTARVLRAARALQAGEAATTTSGLLSAADVQADEAEEAAALAEARHGAGLAPAALGEAVRRERRALQEQLAALAEASGALQHEAQRARDDSQQLVREQFAAKEEAARQAAAAEALRAEHQKDKGFILAVVSSLKDQLGAERHEREQLRAEAARATAAAHESVAAERAAQEKARADAADAARRQAAVETRDVCRDLHRQLCAFCDKWVPSGAEGERVEILGRLNELAELGAVV